MDRILPLDKRKIPKSYMVPMTAGLHRDLQAHYQANYLGKLSFPEYLRMMLSRALDRNENDVIEET